MGTHATPVLTDVTLQELEADPYPHYVRWRRETPAAYLPAIGGWVVSRWDDCDAIGKNEDWTTTDNEFRENYFGPNILSMTGDAHALVRGAIDIPLRPKAVLKYVEELTRPVARDYVARLAPLGRADATTGLLELISVRVVSNVLGMQDVDDATLQRWFIDLSLGNDNRAGDPDIARRSQIAKDEVRAYAEDARDRYLAGADGSILSNLITARRADGSLPPLDELIGTIWVIVLGGFQEPGHGAAASLLGLLENPEQARAVAADSSLVPAAVHEGIRWIAPFGTTQRRAVVDIPVGDVVIPAGDELQLVIASANRDERRYDNPEAFDVFRPRQPVASFGYGAHFCAGHFLARELEKIALEETLAGLPGLRLDPDSAPTTTGFVMRGVKHLPVVWDA